MLHEGMEEIEQYLEANIKIRLSAVLFGSTFPENTKVVVKSEGGVSKAVSIVKQSYVAEDGGINFLKSEYIELTQGKYEAFLDSDGRQVGDSVAFTVHAKIEVAFRRDRCREEVKSAIVVNNANNLADRIHVSCRATDVIMGFGPTDRIFYITPSTMGTKDIDVFVNGQPASSNPHEVYAKSKEDPSFPDHEVIAFAEGESSDDEGN